MKVEVFDNYYDLDQMFLIAIDVYSPARGFLRMTTGPEKGSVREQMLLWDSGDPGRRVSVSNQDPASGE